MFIPMNYVTLAALRWDEGGKQLFLEPQKVKWGALNVPRWLRWLGRGACPQDPLLNMSQSWLALNIQELHIGWDHITLSTNW
jgi:hypothetical protein